jgi:hypothetical protein
MAAPRPEPYIWTTWLTKLLAGEESCEWGAWFRAHYQTYDRVPDTFDRTVWQLQHTALLSDVRENLESEKYAVFLERQNNFRLRSQQSGITIGGRPDLIAIKGNYGLICDAKTGQARPSDHVQVMIYMWGVPHAFPQYRTVSFSGKVAYRGHTVDIPPGAVNESFIGSVGRLIRRVGGSEPLSRFPSALECGFCQIAGTECPARIERSGDLKGDPTVDL